MKTTAKSSTAQYFSSKQIYHTPTVQKLGRLAKITLSDPSGGNDDGAHYTDVGVPGK